MSELSDEQASDVVIELQLPFKTHPPPYFVVHIGPLVTDQYPLHAASVVKDVGAVVHDFVTQYPGTVFVAAIH